MVVAFTGPSRLNRHQELLVVEALENLRPSDTDVWRSGCALGVDTIVAHQADLADVGIALFVPAASHNEKLVAELGVLASVTRCPGEYGKSESYRVRNTMMVNGADHLVAFLKSHVFYRSGEWMTVNIAKELGVPTTKVVI